ncbi:ppGpp synthetase catalytic domain-containing protein (RelA/SpoT-type nucleotidyltranferase) [Polaromonas sp. YR568]|uniref:GTP pyrophosphokinase n=1 Tax=Polaromonas sp. YR568 TaxID=1855301 RepID=UPI0008EA8E41|nr:hypothetical protein [Polaromonas sp. YR568]SFV04560.1 ppGpp synthetase catalytic domain-containing protein (RelA/SpoT-type nucleotidyltranferase) [Polaromonas sp. YR568]
MIEDSTKSQILTEFDNERGIYEDFSRKASELVSQILAASGIVVHSVTSRCKSRESLSRKLGLPEKSYDSLGSVTDISAIRITTYFSDDVDLIAELIEQEFEVAPDHSVDKRISLDPDRFGYQSLHYVVTLAPARCKLVEYRKFNGLKTEIQIRSILQHAWAEIEHDIGYKSASGIPRDVRRRFARVAGLLELADAEFASIRSSLSDYAGAVVREIRQNPAKVELDLLSLRALYEIDSHTKSLDALVAGAMERTLVADPGLVGEQFVGRFLTLGIHRVDEVEVAAERVKDTIAEFTKYWISQFLSKNFKMATGPANAGIGVFYLQYMLVAQTKNRTFIRNFLISNNLGAADDHDAMVDYLLDFSPKATKTGREVSGKNR